MVEYPNCYFIYIKGIYLLGSHGKKAICLALLGADVTVVDISEENRLYASEVASAAGVKLNYICSDVLDKEFSKPKFS